MIDLFQIATETVQHATEAGSQAVAAGNPIERISSNFHIEVPILLAQIVNFLLIFVILKYLAWGPIQKVLDARKTKIADGLQYAEEMKVKLAEAERKQSETLKEAAMEAKTITADAQKTAKEMVEKTQKEAQRRAEELVEQTRESLELERRQMLAEVREHAAHLVALTASKVLRRELKNAEKDAYTQRAVEEISKN